MMTLVTGAELFTGNTALVTAAVLEKKASLKQLVKSWTVSYSGNLVGSILLAAMVATGGTPARLTRTRTLPHTPHQARSARWAALPWAPELTRTPRGLRWVRTGYAYQPPALGTYRRRRVACPQGPAYCTYWMRVPATGVPYIPRTVAPQVVVVP